MTTVGQQKIIAAVLSERDYQDRKWGHPADRPHEVGAWLTLMRVHLAKAEIAWAGSRGDENALKELRKVVALGFACFENHGIFSRSPEQIPVRQ